MSRGPGRATVSRQTEAVLGAAAAHVGAGRLRAGIKALEKHKPALEHPTGQNILGNAHLRAGRIDAALAAFDAAIAQAPRFAEAHCSRGVALQESGRMLEALAAFDQALALQPAYPLAHYNRGNVLKAQGRLDAAVRAYDHAVQMEPRFPEAHLNRGIALLSSGQSKPALAAFDRALALRPEWSEAVLGRATALERLHRPAEALAAIDPLLAAEPDNADALMVRGDALTHLKRGDEAMDSYSKCLDSLTDSTDGLIKRATALVALGRHDEALAVADRAIAAEGGAEAHMARAAALRELGRFTEQLDTLDTAATFGPPGEALHHARAVTLGELGRLDDADAAFEQAIAIGGSNARTRYNRSLLLLHRGDFERGWAEHERRLELPDFAHAPAGSTPRWSGEAITGKSLLVYAERGIGDAIQMLRYLPQLATTRANLTLAVHPALKRLVTSSFTGLDITDLDAAPKDFDRQVSLMSLPHIFQTRVDTVPVPIPYLDAEDALVEKWRDRIGGDGFRIGICWSGDPDHQADRGRSIPLTAFAPLAAIPGVRLISLQAINGLDQLADLPSDMSVETLGDDIADNPDGLAEIAAVTAALDLVISADTAVAHLAGALGRPTWTGIRFQPEWRWPEGKSEPPWYPTMWLFRQPAIGDWAGVINDMSTYLSKHVGAAR
ncbi:MAG: tetratricopeptide repeat protein [Hyphomicrobiales bacterium]|nr:tetratricopeptide repeat protein [Hyphomicrobiales bacterium]